MKITLTSKRILILVAFGFTMAAILFPIPIAAWYSILLPAAHKTGAWKIISHHATAWAHTRSYLPQRAWAVLLHHPHGLLLWLILAAAWTAMFAYMGRDRRGSTSDWGGPPPAGKGQHGTAHWRTQAELAAGFELWGSPPKGGADNASQR